MCDLEPVDFLSFHCRKFCFSELLIEWVPFQLQILSVPCSYFLVIANLQTGCLTLNNMLYIDLEIQLL